MPGPKWYRWWDFGNGTMSDLGSHWNDLPFWALELQSPLTIEASGSPPPHPEIAPASMSATYEYGPRGDQPAVKLTWHQGDNKPEIWTDGGIPKWGDGCLFIGDKGMILSDYSKHLLLPEKQFADFKAPAQAVPRVSEHHAEWIDCCKTGKTPSANFNYAGSAHRSQPSGQYRLSRRQETAVGPDQHEGPERAGSRSAYPMPQAQGMGIDLGTQPHKRSIDLHAACTRREGLAG